MIRDYLSSQGLTVLEAPDGDAMRQVLDEHDVDIVLLDVGLPGEDGLSLARHLRDQRDVGIIMLTAFDDEVDRVLGLELGADDYVGKPFQPRELLARIKALGRRLNRSTGPAEAASASVGPDHDVKFGRFVLRLDARQLVTLDGEDVPLTSMEFDLMKAFVTHPDRVLSRDQLLDMAHNRDWEPFDRSIDIRINRLRKKIETEPSRPALIKTIRGVGYLFSPGG